MDIKNYEHPFPHIIVDDLYNENELSGIWQELEFICNHNKMSLPSKGEAAVQDGEILKVNKVLFLDNVYSDAQLFSNICRINKKVFSDKIFNHPNWFFVTTIPTNYTTLISYYENESYYKRHQDSSDITILTWFYKEPKKFIGGDLIMSVGDDEKLIKISNNRCLIFPSSIFHAVTQISMNEHYEGKMMGRVCMTQFCNRKDDRD